MNRLLGILVAAAMVVASDSRAESVAQRVHQDLSRGEDVVVASYVGLWYVNRHDPAHNLYWGNSCGHATLFSRSNEIRARLPFLTVSRYSKAIEKRLAQDPIAVKVFEASVPGVPGKLKVVTLAYSDMALAVRDMGMQLKTGILPAALASDTSIAPVLSRAYVIGYWGHNVYIGGADVDTLQNVARTVTSTPRAVFFVGCQSARWFPQKFLDGSTEPLLFTTTNMAPEAYVALALYDGLGRGLGADEIRRNAARAYAVYQNLPRPPLSLFINDPTEIQKRMERLPEAEPAARPAPSP